jgi:hypothetical protein
MEAFAMWKSIAGWVSNQVRSQRSKLAAAGGLPASELLPAARVEQVLAEEGIESPSAVYSPLVTLWTFVSQVLSPDHSCRDAVARLRAFLTADGQKPCSTATGGYVKARQRLPERGCQRLARDVGRQMQEQVGGDAKLLRGRPIKLVDGTTVSMPDTLENQAEYPQQPQQQPGLGFPIARLVGLISLASGALLDLKLAPYSGKGTGETTLFRQMWDSLFPGDIAVGDRIFATFWDLAMLKERGVDSVYRQHQRRVTEHQRIKRLGRRDWLLRVPKPDECPDWMDRTTYDAQAAELIVREVTVRVKVRGFRVKWITLVTTLLDADEYPAEELAEVYRARWHAELDLRSIKVTMQMDVLRCKTPQMVRKEIWMHMLAYNLIRTVMADAAAKAECRVREISFKGTWQMLSAYRPLVERARTDDLRALYDGLLEAVASHRVANRPNRFEPRAIKRRPKPHDLLTVPRAEAKRRLAT